VIHLKNIASLEDIEKGCPIHVYLIELYDRYKCLAMMSRVKHNLRLMARQQLINPFMALGLSQKFSFGDDFTKDIFACADTKRLKLVLSFEKTNHELSKESKILLFDQMLKLI